MSARAGGKLLAQRQRHHRACIARRIEHGRPPPQRTCRAATSVPRDSKRGVVLALVAPNCPQKVTEAERKCSSNFVPVVSPRRSVRGAAWSSPPRVCLVSSPPRVCLVNNSGASYAGNGSFVSPLHLVGYHWFLKTQQRTCMTVLLTKKGLVAAAAALLPLLPLLLLRLTFVTTF
jgi:hypothetical protein